MSDQDKDIINKVPSFEEFHKLWMEHEIKIQKALNREQIVFDYTCVNLEDAVELSQNIDSLCKDFFNLKKEVIKLRKERRSWV